MKFREIEPAKPSRYSTDCHLIAIDIHLCTEIACDLESGFIVPTRSVAAKVGCTLGEGGGDDGTLGKTLGNRH